MSYQALYRALRPEFFADIVGQTPIVTTLVNQIELNRVAHAYLFCGSRGTGKTTTAKVFARAVNCEHSRGGEPCGECAACVHLAGDNNMDVIEIDAASNNGVDEMRDLRDKVKYPPAVGRYKVYIIDEAHMLSTGAFNALLKTLEEPPAHALFILATTEPQRLPVTIISRCQRFDFKRIPAVLIAKLLRSAAGEGADETAISEIARAAEGGVRDALSALDVCLSYGAGKLTLEIAREVLGTSGREFMFGFAEALLTYDAPRALALIADVVRDGRDEAAFAREATGHMRALALAKLCPKELSQLLDSTEEDAQRYISQAELADADRLTRVMELFMRAEGDMKWSSQRRTALELCAVRACHPEREPGEDVYGERLARLEKAIAEGAQAAPRPSARPAPEKRAQIKPDASLSAPATPPAKDDAEAYQRAFKALTTANIRLSLLLKKGSFAGVEGDVARVEFEPGTTIYSDIMQAEDKRSIIEKCLSEGFGRPMRVWMGEKRSERPSNKPSAEGKSVLGAAYDMFDRSDVQIVDKISE